MAETSRGYIDSNVSVSAQSMLDHDFETIVTMIRHHAEERGDAVAIVDDGEVTTYGELARAIDRAVTSFQRDACYPGQAIVICAGNSTDYAVAYLGAVAAGLVVSPLSPALSVEQFTRMVQDCEACWAFLDQTAEGIFAPVLAKFGIGACRLGGGAHGGFARWLASEAKPDPVAIQAEDPFNIIYSSGTTGAPKGIVQSHVMRWRQVKMLRAYGFDAASVTLLSTPLYSNTTLAGLFPTIACGGKVVLMRKFDGSRFLELSQEHRVTHAMLVPVQFRRIMDVAEFDSFDLSSYVMKLAASAPFSVELKADVLDRWPGGLVELYGATEGGGLCVLDARLHPDKLGTVGRPYPGHDIRLIRDDGTECASGEDGEVVGRSGAMMDGYYQDPVRTAEVEWFSDAGDRYLRNGDIARFDEDGFLTIIDRKKDMIISGGFNIYPSDLEAVLEKHPSVLEAAVVGIPSERWGETPVAFVAAREGAVLSREELASFADQSISRTQRPSVYHIVAALPRSTIGKVLKKNLRELAIALAEGEG